MLRNSFYLFIIQNTSLEICILGKLSIYFLGSLRLLYNLLLEPLIAGKKYINQFIEFDFFFGGGVVTLYFLFWGGGATYSINYFIPDNHIEIPMWLILFSNIINIIVPGTYLECAFTTAYCHSALYLNKDE